MKTALGYTLSSLEWMRLPSAIPHLIVWRHVPSWLCVVETDGPVDDEDGRDWYHVSCSYPDRVPSYDDLLRMKRAFLKGRTALQIFPPEEQHISGEKNPLGNPFVLHLWCCVSEDGAGLPDFGRYGHI